jgi:surface protein
MFSSCSSLKSLPDISNWKTENVKEMYLMFSGCKSLLSFPDISKWDFSNVYSLKWIFIGCPQKISLPKLPEISLFGGYMYEKQFLKFLDILRVSLLKKDKKENQFEINIGSKDINNASLQIKSFDKNQYEEDFEIPSDYLKKAQWIISLNIELKEESYEWEQLRAFLDNIPKIKEKYELKFRKIGKKIYFDNFNG